VGVVDIFFFFGWDNEIIMQSDSIHVEPERQPRPVRARSFLDGTNNPEPETSDPSSQGATDKDVHANRYDFYDVNRGVSANPYEEYREDSKNVVNKLAEAEELERQKGLAINTNAENTNGPHVPETPTIIRHARHVTEKVGDGFKRMMMCVGIPYLLHHSRPIVILPFAMAYFSLFISDSIIVGRSNTTYRFDSDCTNISVYLIVEIITTAFFTLYFLSLYIDLKAKQPTIAELEHDVALPPIVPSVELDVDAEMQKEQSRRVKVSLAVEYGWLFLLLLFFSLIWALWGAGVINTKHGSNCAAKQPPLVRLATANVVIALFHFTTPLWIHCYDVLFPRSRR